MRHNNSEDGNVRRMSNGSIDYAHYVRVSRDLRREALQAAFAAQWQAFETALGPIGRLMHRSIRALSITVCGIFRRRNQYSPSQ